jgi:hypothetical protein
LAKDSAIEFKGGQITSLAANAQLHLYGNDAFIEDSTALGSNSALKGLASIGAGAIFGIHNKAAVSTSGSLANDGTIRLDIVGGDGGSSLTVGGTLTNSGSLSIGNATLSALDEAAASSLDNTGSISLTGSSANQALLDVTAGSAGFGTAGVLTGNVALTGDSAIEFASDEITSLAANAQLQLNGSDAFIEDSTALGSNSALTGLASIGAGATLDLESGAPGFPGGGGPEVMTGALVNDGNIQIDASVSSGGSSLSVAGALTNSGILSVDTGYGASGSTLSIGGTLTNTGTLDIGSIANGTTSVTAKSFVNRGTVNLTGTYFFHPITLNVSGALTNNGSISIFDDTEELAGAVDGTGSFSLSTRYRATNLVFDSSVSSGQTINEIAPLLGGNAETLTLEQAQSFGGTISGFGTGDTIDAANLHFSRITTPPIFVENSAGTGGTLTLTNPSQNLTANIQMTGSYTATDFSLVADSGTGTLVKFV